MTLRILHCPTAVGGNPQGLARAERKLGLQSWAVSFTESPFHYELDEVLWKDHSDAVRNELSRWKLLWRALTDYDVIHFNFGMSLSPQRIGRASASSRVTGVLRGASRVYTRLLEFRDLPLLKLFDKAIFVTYQGDDARQGDYCLAHFRISPAQEVDPDYYSPASDERKRREIAIFDRYADRIYALNPDLLHVLPKRASFLPYAHIDLDVWKPAERLPDTARRPLVVHAPSHRGFKGTRHILAAVERIRGEGVGFDFMLVENLPHAEARRIYERADLVVDQVLAGWYGGLAVEAMALGKPVVAYIRPEDLTFIPDEMRRALAVISAEPATIYQVLRELLTTRRHQLPELGVNSRRYVEVWHDPLKIAARLAEDYRAALKGQP
jgi:glycosyltransferase involved in cell wall biosynthesis